ncbi:hypothetical protein LX36DRAFT_709346 [Colletotrichum falcatum]|nr:hypothetical protein LX36DRAFT_709346 [Colletotrichum falcatum]
MQSRLLLLAAAAAAATGCLAAGVRDLSGSPPQDLRRGVVASLEARDGPMCFAVVSAHATVTAQFPPAPQALVTGRDLPQITDPCRFPSVTGSVGDALTSYSAAVQSWEDAYMTEIQAIWDACSNAAAIDSFITGFSDYVCPTAFAAAAAAGHEATVTATTTAAGEATAAAEPTASSAAAASTATTTAASTTAVSAAAAPRETGMLVAAVAAAAGFVGSGS